MVIFEHRTWLHRRILGCLWELSVEEILETCLFPVCSFHEGLDFACYNYELDSNEKKTEPRKQLRLSLFVLVIICMP